MKILLLSLFILSITGCALSKPPSSILQAPANDISLAEASNDTQQFLNANIRWGGRVLKVIEVDTDHGKRLKIEIFELPLGDKGRPTSTEASSGRFIAQILPPYKKSRYYRNRHITVTGKLSHYEEYPLTNGNTQKLPVIDTLDKFTWQSNDNSYSVSPIYSGGFGHHSVFFFGHQRFYQHKFRSSHIKHKTKH